MSKKTISLCWMGKYKVAAAYEAVADIPVMLTVDLRQLATSGGQEKALHLNPDEIFSYDDALERRILGDLEGKSASATKSISPPLSAASSASSKSSSSSSTTRNSANAVSVEAALSELCIGGEWTADRTDADSEVSRTTTMPIASEEWQAKARDAAQSYFPDESGERRADFESLYVQYYSNQLADAKASVPEAGSTKAASDMDLLRAFFLYDGNVDKALALLAALKQLRELGFADDQILQALYLHENNQERALEYLIRENK